MTEQNEKKLYDLTIDPEFRDLIPPLSEEERKLLEDSIASNGCESPIIVWNGIIVDGHNRYAVCKKRGVPFSLQEKEFENRDTAAVDAAQSARSAQSEQLPEEQSGAAAGTVAEN